MYIDLPWVRPLRWYITHGRCSCVYRTRHLACPGLLLWCLQLLSVASVLSRPPHAAQHHRLLLLLLLSLPIQVSTDSLPTNIPIRKHDCAMCCLHVVSFVAAGVLSMCALVAYTPRSLLLSLICDTMDVDISLHKFTTHCYPVLLYEMCDLICVWQMQSLHSLKSSSSSNIFQVVLCWFISAPCAVRRAGH